MALKDLYEWRRRPVSRINEAPNESNPAGGSEPLYSRDGAGLLSLNGQLFILGGWNTYGPPDRRSPPWYPEETTNEVWSSHDGVTWKRLLAHNPDPPMRGANARWRRRHTAGWIVHNNKLFTIGGDQYIPVNDCFYGDVWCSTDGVKWRQKVRRAKPFRVPNTKGRMLHSVGTYNGKLWLFGGHAAIFGAGPASLVPSSALNDLWCSGDEGVTWMKKAVSSPSRPSPRGMIYNLVEWKGYLWLCGGGLYDPTDNRTSFNDVWRYDEDSDQWTEVLPSETKAPFSRWSPRHYHNVVTFDDRLWVMSGNGPSNNQPLDRNLNDVWATDDGTNWEPLDVEPVWNPGHADGVCLTPEGLWHATGNGTFDIEIVDVWVLTRK